MDSSILNEQIAFEKASYGDNLPCSTDLNKFDERIKGKESRRGLENKKKHTYAETPLSFEEEEK